MNINPDLYKSLNDFVQNIIRSSQIQQSLNSIAYEATASLRESVNQLANEITSSFKNIRPFDEIATYFSDLEKQFQVTEAEATSILRKYKWIIGPSLPLEFIYQVIKVGRKSGNQRGAINCLFIDYLTPDKCRNLSKIVDTWETKHLYKQRIKIIRDCVSALGQTNKKFNPSNLVIPTLVSQIDGILTEHLELKGISKSDKAWKDKFRQDAGNDLSANLANDLLLGILFQKAYRGDALKIPTTFNRHKILHGECTRYGRVDNSLRAFLLLDFLAEL